MVEQVYPVQTETAENDFIESSKAFIVGSGIVLGYITVCFAALIYVLWLITNIYELLVGLSIFYDLIRYSNVWVGLLIAIGFLALNFLAISIIFYIVRLIIKAIKNLK